MLLSIIIVVVLFDRFIMWLSESEKSIFAIMVDTIVHWLLGSDEGNHFNEN